MPMEANSRFDAQALVENGKTNEGDVALKFADNNGQTHILTLPVVASMALAKALTDIVEKSTLPKEQLPVLSRNIRTWAVGRANEAPILLLKLNEEPPIAFALPDAKKLWRQIREESEAIEKRPPPRKQ